MSIPVTRTKILAPRRRSDLLSRERVLALLDDLPARRLTLIVAPAGYGKTSLLVDFTHRSDMPVCWYSVDGLDRDLQRFAAHFIGAIRIQFPTFGKRSLALMQSASAADLHGEQLLTTLVNEIYETIEEQFVIVLDDYHLVGESDEINHFVNQFILRVDERCHMVIASRSLLSLPDLPVLVAHGQVGGLGMKELAFTPEEIQALVRQNYQQAMPDTVAAELAAETEGWITGLLLSAQTMWQGLADQQRVARVSGVGVYEYLAQQVLAQQPASVQDFLLRTSLLDEFNADFCETVLGPANYADGRDWQSLIDYVSHHNLFVQPIGEQGTWLRYHHLFQEFLQTHLADRRPAERDRILRRLGELYLEHEDWERAHDAYRRLGDVEAMADMLVAAGVPMVRSGRLTALGEWIDALPDEVVHGRPMLLSLRGTVYFMVGEVQQSLTWLNQAEAALRATDDRAGLARTLARRAIAHRFLARYRDALADADRAIELTAHDETVQDIHAEALRAKGATLYQMGQTNKAIKWWKESLALHEHIGENQNGAMLLLDLGTGYMYTGHYDQALTYYQRALEYWQQGSNLVWQANVLNNLGVLHHLRGEYEQANALLEDTLACAWQSGYVRMEAFALTSIGDLYVDLDAPEAALAAYQEARTTARRSDERSLLQYLDVAEARVAWLQGDTTGAERLLASAEQRAHESSSNLEQGLCRLEAGRTKLAAGCPEAAAAALEGAVRRFEDGGQRIEEAQARLYLAAAYTQLDRKEAARNQLTQVLTSSFEESRHPLVSAARQVEPALRAFRDDAGVGADVARLLEEVRRFERTIPAIRRRLRRHAELVPFAAPRLTVKALGDVQILLDGEPVTGSDWKSQTARDLFLCLLAHPDGLSREEIGTLFWPDHSPEQLKAVFKKTIYRVRRALGSESVLFDGERYHFNHELDYEYDVETMLAHVDRAEAARSDEERIAALQEVARLYAGPYASDLDAPWAWTDRERLARRYTEAMLTLIELYLEHQEPDKALTYCHQLLTADPCLEEAHQLAMRAYAAKGNRVAVARQFQRCRQVLKDQINITPSPQTEGLYRQLTR